MAVHRWWILASSCLLLLTGRVAAEGESAEKKADGKPACCCCNRAPAKVAKCCEDRGCPGSTTCTKEGCPPCYLDVATKAGMPLPMGPIFLVVPGPLPFLPPPAHGGPAPTGVVLPHPIYPAPMPQATTGYAELVPAPRPVSWTAPASAILPCAAVTPPCPACPADQAERLRASDCLGTRGPRGEQCDRMHVIEIRLVSRGPNGEERVECGPKMTVMDGATAVMQQGSCIALQDGSVQDLVRCSHTVKPEDQVHLGFSLTARAESLEDDRVRLDVQLRRSEVEQATQDGIVVLGSTVRTALKVKVGKPVKVVVEKDDEGEARCWVELTVRQPAN